MVNPWYELFTWLPGILVAIVLHESAHAFVADRLGDPTPRQLGRVTLNPLAHLDPLGTLLLVVAHFGWGRPVPVNTANLRNPRRDMVWISLSGPLANLLTGAIFGLLLRLGGPSLLALPAHGLLVYQMLQALIFISFVLALFNLLPVPPLDGFSVLPGLLPAAWSAVLNRHAGKLSWGLIAIVAVDYLTDMSLLSILLRAPSRWLYHLLVGSGPI